MKVKRMILDTVEDLENVLLLVKIVQPFPWISVQQVYLGRTMISHYIYIALVCTNKA